jgi:hypothetical protein
MDKFKVEDFLHAEVIMYMSAFVSFIGGETHAGDIF